MKQIKKQDDNKVRHNRIFVLDTNVLLHDSNSLVAFQGVTVGIPFVVLEELDTFKKENNELGRNARHTIRMLDELRKVGSLQEGVKLQESIIKVFYTPEDSEVHVCSSSTDNEIIALIQSLTEKGNKVTFVTKDINARVKADALGLEAEDYVKGAISAEEYYKGWTRIPVSAADLKNVSPEKVKEFVKDQPLFPNQYIIFESNNNPHNIRLFRHIGNDHFKAVTHQNTLGAFGARNTEQLMALDLLLDDSVKLVVLSGPAGTGKTFLALLVGFYKVVRMREFRKLLVSRPVVALGNDVGYLPGELKEKLRNWMMPIYDNLEFIFSKTSRDEEMTIPSNTKERRNDRRHPHHRLHVNMIDQLEEKGLLSMEAITYMRGRSIPNQFVFIDEVQNLTPHEVKTIVSRAGEGTKVVLAGDPHQIDSPFLDFTSNGLTVTSEKMKEEAVFGSVYLEISERSQLAQLAATLL